MDLTAEQEFLDGMRRQAEKEGVDLPEFWELLNSAQEDINQVVFQSGADGQQ